MSDIEILLQGSGITRVQATEGFSGKFKMVYLLKAVNPYKKIIISEDNADSFQTFYHLQTLNTVIIAAIKKCLILDKTYKTDGIRKQYDKSKKEYINIFVIILFVCTIINDIYTIYTNHLTNKDDESNEFNLLKKENNALYTSLVNIIETNNSEIEKKLPTYTTAILYIIFNKYYNTFDIKMDLTTFISNLSKDQPQEYPILAFNFFFNDNYIQGTNYLESTEEYTYGNITCKAYKEYEQSIFNIEAPLPAKAYKPLSSLNEENIKPEKRAAAEESSAITPKTNVLLNPGVESQPVDPVTKQLISSLERNVIASAKIAVSSQQGAGGFRNTIERLTRERDEAKRDRDELYGKLRVALEERGNIFQERLAAQKELSNLQGRFAVSKLAQTRSNSRMHAELAEATAAKEDQRVKDLREVLRSKLVEFTQLKKNKESLEIATQKADEVAQATIRKLEDRLKKAEEDAKRANEAREAAMRTVEESEQVFSNRIKLENSILEEEIRRQKQTMELAETRLQSAITEKEALKIKAASNAANASEIINSLKAEIKAQAELAKSRAALSRALLQASVLREDAITEKLENAESEKEIAIRAKEDALNREEQLKREADEARSAVSAARNVGQIKDLANQAAEQASQRLTTLEGEITEHKRVSEASEKRLEELLSENEVIRLQLQEESAKTTIIAEELKTLEEAKIAAETYAAEATRELARAEQTIRVSSSQAEEATSLAAEAELRLQEVTAVLAEKVAATAALEEQLSVITQSDQTAQSEILREAREKEADAVRLVEEARTIKAKADQDVVKAQLEKVRLVALAKEESDRAILNAKEQIALAESARNVAVAAEVAATERSSANKQNKNAALLRAQEADEARKAAEEARAESEQARKAAQEARTLSESMREAAVTAQAESERALAESLVAKRQAEVKTSEKEVEKKAAIELATTKNAEAEAARKAAQEALAIADKALRDSEKAIEREQEKHQAEIDKTREAFEAAYNALATQLREKNAALNASGELLKEKVAAEAIATQELATAKAELVKSEQDLAKVILEKNYALSSAISTQEQKDKIEQKVKAAEILASSVQKRFKAAEAALADAHTQVNTEKALAKSQSNRANAAERDAEEARTRAAQFEQNKNVAIHEAEFARQFAQEQATEARVAVQTAESIAKQARARVNSTRSFTIEEFGKTEQERRQIEARAKKAEEDLAEAQARAKKAEDALAEAQAQVANAQSQVANAQAQVKTPEINLRQLNNTSELDKKNKEIEELKNEILIVLRILARTKIKPTKIVKESGDLKTQKLHNLIGVYNNPLELLTHLDTLGTDEDEELKKLIAAMKKELENTNS
jgi:hypothetical protein